MNDWVSGENAGGWFIKSKENYIDVNFIQWMLSGCDFEHTIKHIVTYVF